MTSSWWTSIYNAEDLTVRLQSFNREPPHINKIRMALLAANLTNIALTVSIYGPAELIHFFSNWAVCATSLYLAVAIAARRYY